MRKLVGVAALALAACAAGSTPGASAPAKPIMQLAAGGVTPEELQAIGAICSAEGRLSSPRAKDIVLGDGVGTGGFKVDSTNPDAQKWFDYGLALSHAFYHEDAKVAMSKSMAADPKCALCAWGLAWTLGPTLNYQLIEPQRVEALKAAQQARSLVKPGDEKARRLAESIVARYAESKTSTEPAYGQAMLAIAQAYPDDTEIAVLAAHALMIPIRGGDKQGLKAAMGLLEDVLKKRPDDTAAIHYWIHATEFDGHADDAIPFAEKLGRLAPKASHLVHMPAHTFFHAGRYEDAALVNAAAIEADGAWLGRGVNAPAVPMYYAHNLAFGLSGAMMSGDAELALKYEEHAPKMWTASMDAALRGPILPRTWVALARYRPDAMLAVPKPAQADADKDARFDIYWRYSRGEAFLLKGDVAAAKSEVAELARVKESPLQIVASDTLTGRIAMVEGRPLDAAKLFETAADLQDKDLVGLMDPPSWWYPVRRSAAAAYLKAGDFAKAEAVARKSLEGWKHDPLALWVLAKAQAGQGRSGAAALDEARKVWRGNFDSITVDAI